MPNILMYDSTNSADIPRSAQAVMPYVDGAQSAWSDAELAAWLHVPQVRLSTDFDTDAGDGWDAELGNVSSPWDPRIRRKHLALIRKGVSAPWGYCQRSWWAPLLVTLAGLPVRWVIADWTGVPHVLSGATAVQFASPSTGSGGHYDISVIDSAAFAAPPPQQLTGGKPVLDANDLAQFDAAILKIAYVTAQNTKTIRAIAQKLGVPFDDQVIHQDASGVDPGFDTQVAAAMAKRPDIHGAVNNVLTEGTGL